MKWDKIRQKNQGWDLKQTKRQHVWLLLHTQTQICAQRQPARFTFRKVLETIKRTPKHFYLKHLPVISNCHYSN